jgi:hypothetical protein
MRSSALVLATLIFSLPASAEAWREYTYPGSFFSVSFPAQPTAETITYKTAEGALVEARVYSLNQNDSVLKMTIADLSDVRTEETAVIGHAIKTLSERGEIKLDIPHRINRVYGRQLSIAGADGSHSSIAVFYYRHRLYQIEGIALPTGNDTADAIRFQQSLTFLNGYNNRQRVEPTIEPPRRFFDGELNR